MNLNDILKDSVDPQNHIGLPPGARVEFIVNGSTGRSNGLLVTRTVDTGPGGENDPNRMLAKIVASAECTRTATQSCKARPQPLPPPSEAWLGDCSAGARSAICISPKS